MAATDDRIAVEGYARAIFTVAQAEDALERIADELFRVARAVQSNPELSQRLSEPQLDTATKLDIIDGLLSGRAHPQTVSAVSYVVQSGRARLLGSIADRVAQGAAATRQRSLAEVRTAVPLDDDQKQRMAAGLSRATGKQVEITNIVDPDVVGGVLATMGDTVIDGSVARRLSELRSTMTGS